MTGALHVPETNALVLSHKHHQNEPVHEKTNNVGSNHVRHNPDCTVAEDGYGLEILDLESRGIVLSV